MRVKLGIDPTAKDLHLGHTVQLRKLKQYQDAGDTAVLIIGDFTVLIGDPSGRNDARPMLTREQVKDNETAYIEMAGKVLDIKKAEIHRNSEWFGDKGMDFLMDLMRRVTVAQVLEREDFQKRMKSGTDIALLEIIYSLLQGYDSVAVKADIEIGGTDQIFNLLMGRRMQRSFGMKEQEVVTYPLLEGLDGTHKMSKSLGNYVGLNDAPVEMFGKIMSIPDFLMEKYYTLLTDVVFDPKMPPKETKEKLAGAIVSLYHGEAESKKARDEFARIFSKGETPEHMPEHQAGNIIEVLLDAGLVKSKSDAMRLIKQNAVKINGKAVAFGADRFSLKAGDIIKVGARRFLKIV